MTPPNKKTAVILFNLGGPDSLKAVRPFLFNLFADKAIIRLPQPFRYLLAQFISKTRAKKAIGIYQKMGGKSPLLENTAAQARALEESLKGEGSEYKVFIAMRYWHPFTEETVKEVVKYNPDEVVLLPLYPHYSTTTTESSFKEWYRVAKDINVPVREVESYPLDELYICAHVETLLPIYKEALKYGTPRILFSAHSLPQKIVDKGDPYQEQTIQTAEAIISSLDISNLDRDIDYVVCYQSRVGRLKWLEPTTDTEIKRASADKVPVIVVPISFVSEHSETLVELDIDYRDLAESLGVPFYGRVPTLSCHPLFIELLQKKVLGF
ncbi:MAG: ferrochelatase [Alphaproteobacteria bacterium]|nr:ferrochelatase [Alphaproteobacteria bacterium]